MNVLSFMNLNNTYKALEPTLMRGTLKALYRIRKFQCYKALLKANGGHHLEESSNTESFVTQHLRQHREATIGTLVVPAPSPEKEGGRR